MLIATLAVTVTLWLTALVFAMRMQSARIKEQRRAIERDQ